MSKVGRYPDDYYQDLERSVIALAHSFAGRLPDELIAVSVKFAHHSEYGLAFEWVVQGIPHHNVAVHETERQEIWRLSGLMGFDDDVAAAFARLEEPG
ncbi:hypothetical protein D1871_22625 [Nakamurella silvestris]|nr:hypothetical protein D1871_22625 [Nakamurella silvestris]